MGALPEPSGSGVNGEAAIFVGSRNVAVMLGSASRCVSLLIEFGIMLMTLTGIT